jgi:hypothetical protein
MAGRTYALLFLAGMTALITAPSVSAHEDECFVNVHYGGIQAHLVCDGGGASDPDDVPVCGRVGSTEHCVHVPMPSWNDVEPFYDFAGRATGWALGALGVGGR